MKNRFYLAGALACGLALAAGAPLIAHHSVSAQYDSTKRETLQGPVHKLDWINPHARFLMDVTGADGKVTRWEVELGAPAILMRNGWTKNALPLGKSVTVTGRPAKDGSKMIYANSIVLADGKRVFSGSPGELGGTEP